MWLFTKHPEKIQKYRQTCNLKHLSQNELDKACLAHDLSYSDSKDLAERTISDKTFDTRTGLGWSVNEQPPEELHKPVIKKFKRGKVSARFQDNTWAVDLAKMGSLSSKNKNVRYLLCAMYVFIKYACLKL